MGWAIGLVVVIGVVCLLVVSPGFRAIAALLLLGGGIVWLLDYKAQVDEEKSSRAAWRLAIPHVSARLDIDRRFVTGIIENTGTLHTLKRTIAKVRVSNCPSNPVDWKQCKIVGESEILISVVVPPGQQRSFEVPANLYDMAPVEPDKWSWTLAISQVYVD